MNVEVKKHQFNLPRRVHFFLAKFFWATGGSPFGCGASPLYDFFDIDFVFACFEDILNKAAKKEGLRVALQN